MPSEVRLQPDYHLDVYISTYDAVSRRVAYATLSCVVASIDNRATQHCPRGSLEKAMHLHDCKHAYSVNSLVPRTGPVYVLVSTGAADVTLQGLNGGYVGGDYSTGKGRRVRDPDASVASGRSWGDDSLPSMRDDVGKGAAA